MPLLRDRVAALEEALQNIQSTIESPSGGAQPPPAKEQPRPQPQPQKDYTYPRRRAAI